MQHSPLNLIALLAMLAAAAPASAADPLFKAGDITVEQPWSRATPGGSTVAVGYMTIRNAGPAPDRLLSATTAVAARTGPHSMTMAGGVMQMRALPGGIAVPAHGTATLAPNGDHLMLEGLKRPLKAGERFAGTLVFEHAGPIAVTFTVESVGARAPGDGKPVPAATMDMPMK